MDKFNHRQLIVKSLLEHAPKLSAQEVDEFDAMVCKALGIDQEEHPPLFLDSFLLA
jgi:hypothetical protein|tara:strand:+ start:97 stop:264 length:168 start_codon:yes stop_codon:yes gene_type:complete